MTRYALHMRRDALSAVAEDGGVAVVPTGSLEQHGAHLPVGTDSLLAEAVSRESVERVVEHGSEAVVFPAIWTGFSPHHVPLGATVSLAKETLVALLDDVCSSLIDAGFESILLVNGHGGNRPAVSLVSGDIGTRQADTDVGDVSYLALARPFVNDIREGEPGSAYHAGEIETALMLHLYEEFVAMDQARDHREDPVTSFSGSDMFHGGPLGMRRTYDRLTEDGVRGEPSLATAETGAALFEGISERLAELIEEFSHLD